MPSKLNAKLATALLCLIIVSIPAMATALEGGGVGINPATPRPPEATSSGSWFTYEVDPGTIINDRVQVKNTRDEDMAVRLEGLDAFLTRDGSFALTDNESTNQDIGTWITLAEHEFIMPPGSEKIVPFTVTVPENAEVGDHFGGIVIYKSSLTPDATIKSGGSTVNIITRVGARMYLTVKGDMVRDLRLASKAFYGHGKQMRFRFTWDNRGNIRAIPTLTGKIYGVFGLYDEVKDLEIGQVFPKKPVTHYLAWPGKSRPAFGPYLAILEIKDSYASANPNSTLPPPSPPIKVWLLTFFIPYTQVAIVLGILFLLWFIWQFASWKRLSNLARRPVIAYKIKKGDHLTNVAQQYGASWKLVARLNNLKAPYGIEEGHTLYIPDASGTRMDIDIPHFLAFLIKPLAKKSIRQPKEETIIVERGDTKKDIEEFTKLPWATIAKHNDLKPTARLKAGWELKLPPKRHRKR